MSRGHYKRTEEHKRKISETLKKLGIVPPSRKGAKMTEEQRKRCSLVKKGKIPKNVLGGWNKGLKMPQIRGEKNCHWKGGLTSESNCLKNSIEYRLWRESVFVRDNWTCKKCNIKGIFLHAHHVRNFSEEKELRISIENGITLCKKCHREFHKIYNRKHNTKEQLKEFYAIH